MTDKLKPFHELTDAEFAALVESKITWHDVAEMHPKPTWCSYPNAVDPLGGCWSLVERRVTGIEFCKTCECFSERKVEQP